MLYLDKNLNLICSSLLLPVYWIMYKHYREKFHVNHFWEFKGSILTENLDFFLLVTKITVFLFNTINTICDNKCYPKSFSIHE